jgi:ATP/ADP translocase
MTFKEWVIDIFKDERGAISVKPVIAFIGALFLCGTMLANSFTEEHFKPAAELVNAVMVVTAIGMGADTLDKFTKKGGDATTKTEEEEG